MNQERLNELRARMQRADIDYYYVPSADAHHNEYVPECWQRRAWVTGFTGSAGDALIGKENAYLWTDGRYFLQAEQQLDPSCFQLVKQLQGTPLINEWLKEQGQQLRVGVDPILLTLQQQQKWDAALNSTNSELVPIDENWIDAIWKDQPEVPRAPIHRLEHRYTGRDTHDKLADLRKALVDHKVLSTVLSRLDVIAWLFNIRGNDIEYNPLTISYAIITQSNATLFINPKKLSDDDKAYFQSNKVALKNYQAFPDALHSLKGSVLLDPQNTSWWTLQQLKQSHNVFAANPITLMKALKNPTEQDGMRKAHRIDAIAMVKFLYWLENHWQDGVTEISAADQLEKFRREDDRCKELSFSTISGFASNGAIIHYFPEKGTNKTIDDSALYLLDSGGQYFEGTTDITRTIHLGEPTAEEKQHYTLVLKGHIALRHTAFGPNTCGEQIDGFARKPLQEAGYDYAHGTGHGVGCYLCVHEGPQVISPRPSNVPLYPGMCVSNEPGVYFKDHYGIRIENVCLIQVIDDDPKLYQLDDLTVVPYARKLINLSMLNAQEVQWIDDYHQLIYEQIASDLPNALSEWLKEATKSLKSYP